MQFLRFFFEFFFWKLIWIVESSFFFKFLSIFYFSLEFSNFEFLIFFFVFLKGLILQISVKRIRRYRHIEETKMIINIKLVRTLARGQPFFWLVRILGKIKFRKLESPSVIKLFRCDWSPGIFTHLKINFVKINFEHFKIEILGFGGSLILREGSMKRAPRNTPAKQRLHNIDHHLFLVSSSCLNYILLKRRHFILIWLFYF